MSIVESIKSLFVSNRCAKCSRRIFFREVSVGPDGFKKRNGKVIGMVEF